MYSPDLAWLVPCFKVSLENRNARFFIISIFLIMVYICFILFKNCFPTLKDTNLFSLNGIKVVLLTYESFIHSEPILDYAIGSGPTALFPHVHNRF